MGLHQLGIQRGETVAIIGENEPQHYWAEYAAQAVGCKVISLYPDLTADEVQYLLDDSEAVCLFAQDQEQVDKGLAVKTATPNLRHIVYWDARACGRTKTLYCASFISCRARGGPSAKRMG